MSMPTACLRRASTSVALMAALLVALAPPPAHAAATLHTGNFVDDDERCALALSFITGQTLSARTLSYAGGAASDGALVAAGGFAPVLSLFDASGLLLQNVVGSATPCSGNSGGVDPASGFCWDAVFSAMLVAGEYTLVLSQDGNVPFGPYLADGFSMSGSPDYTGWTWLGEGGHRFINADLSQRSGHWALEVHSAAVAAPVPVPATSGLLLAGLAALATARRRPAVRAMADATNPSTPNHCRP
jgi:hypothetical protein